MGALDAMGGWPVGRAAAAVIVDGAVAETHGPTASSFELASVTKLLTAAAVHLATEEAIVALDDGCGPAGSTVAHLLAHAGGVSPDGDGEATEPATRRIYSNRGYELLADHVAERAGMPFADYLQAGVLEPLGLGDTELRGSPAHGAVSTVDDLVGFLTGLERLLAAETRRAMTEPAWPELPGILPGFGRQDPNLWGLGPEIRGTKSPHWTAPENDPSTWGHFGRSGTMLWMDPSAEVALVVLTDEPFGPWATRAWPELGSEVLGAHAR